jgi:hypothetical protein
MVLKNGLSRMRGDLHVRFSGGGGAVMRCCYPTRCMTAIDGTKTFWRRKILAMSGRMSACRGAWNCQQQAAVVKMRRRKCFNRAPNNGDIVRSRRRLSLFCKKQLANDLG